MNKWLEREKSIIFQEIEGHVNLPIPVKEQLNDWITDIHVALSAGNISKENEKKCWKAFGNIVEESGLYELYRFYDSFENLYDYLENYYNCFPVGITEEGRTAAMGYVEVLAPQNEKVGRFLTIYMPVNWEELNTFLQTKGVETWTSLEVCSIHSEQCQDILDFLTDEDMPDYPDLYEANRFFERYAELSEEQRTMLEYTIDIHKPKTFWAATDLSRKMDTVCVVNDISTHKQLGEFLVENEMTAVAFPDEVLPYLDYALIGEEYMKQHNGVMWGNRYVEDTACSQAEQETAKETEQDSVQPVEQEAENDLTM